MLPDKKCLHIIAKLEENGFQTYITGKSVRDIIMQRPIHNFDIMTNADVSQITEIFSCENEFSVKTGHVSVIVNCNGTTFNVETLKTDENSFKTALKEKLSQLDFTVNAIAMDALGNLYDPFGGRCDIDKRVLKCIGEPENRFSEDPLRILRTLRSASSLNFNIDRQTSEAAKKMCDNLKDISAEGIRSEFVKILCGVNATKILLEYREIIAIIVPEIAACFDFQQFSRYHKYDVYEHTARAVGNIAINEKNTEILRITMFFHDIGKPEMFTCDEKGFGHFKGHAQSSAKITEKIMRRMEFDEQIIKRVCTIIYHHSDRIQTEQQIRNMISKIGADLFFMLIEAKKADNSAKCEYVAAENDELNNTVAIAKKLYQEILK